MSGPKNQNVPSAVRPAVATPVSQKAPQGTDSAPSDEDRILGEMMLEEAEAAMAKERADLEDEEKMRKDAVAARRKTLLGEDNAPSPRDLEKLVQERAEALLRERDARSETPEASPEVRALAARSLNERALQERLEKGSEVVFPLRTENRIKIGKVWYQFQARVPKRVPCEIVSILAEKGIIPPR